DAHFPAPGVRKVADDELQESIRLKDSLQAEREVLNLEIMMLQRERVKLFQDIHDIMLAKSAAQAQQLVEEDTLQLPAVPLIPTETHPPEPPAFWKPGPSVRPVTPIDEGPAMPFLDYGPFGPRSRAASLSETTSKTAPLEMPPALEAVLRVVSATARRRPRRTVSEGTGVELEGGKTPTAWRTVKVRRFGGQTVLL
ncbi:hypothetical protein H0H81_009002, partial [Sphagnurus paluster]